MNPAATTHDGRDPALPGSRLSSHEAPRTAAARWPRRAAAAGLLLLIVLGLGLAAVNGWAEYHFRAARADLKRLRLPAARDHLTACLRVWPNSSRVNFLAARTARRLGDLDAAERYLQRCQDRAGVAADDIVLERMMIRAQRGDVEEVLPGLRDQVEKGHPDSLLMLEAMARGYATLYRFNNVDEIVRLWLERDPDSTLALFFQAWIREQLGPREESVQGYRTVLERDPENDEARLRLANLLLERSQPQEAVAHLERLVRRQPDNLAAKVRLARSWHDLGRLDEARDLLQTVLAVESEYAPALTALGRLALQQGQPAEAENALRKAADIDRTDYQAVYLLHQALQRQEKSAAALKVQERMLVMEADIRQIHDIVTRQISQRPEDPELHVRAGVIMMRTGDPREGLRWLFQALKYDPLYPRAHAELARHFEATGDTRRANQHRRLAGEAPAPH